MANAQASILVRSLPREASDFVAVDFERYYRRWSPEVQRLEILQRDLGGHGAGLRLRQAQGVMTTPVPMHDHLQGLGCLVGVDDDLVDQGPGDLLFQHRRTRGIVPRAHKVVTQREVENARSRRR